MSINLQNASIDIVLSDRLFVSFINSCIKCKEDLAEYIFGFINEPVVDIKFFTVYSEKDSTIKKAVYYQKDVVLGLKDKLCLDDIVSIKFSFEMGAVSYCDIYDFRNLKLSFGVADEDLFSFGEDGCRNKYYF